ncbi:hypothetical protein R1flu_024455 [Riccia fluitans]|uniref:Uncharacterized protein n=1 Tax=Riccia fluitans TaxID=41844 RepID=A0ABD1XZ22_9MARC
MGLSNLSKVLGFVLLQVMLIDMIFVSQSECRLDESTSRHLLKLVSSPSVLLNYHNGPTLSSSPRSTISSSSVYIIWYGDFSESQKSIVRDFFGSFNSDLEGPSVSSWWKVTNGYTDTRCWTIPSQIYLEAEMSDSSSSRGKFLKNSDLEESFLLKQPRSELQSLNNPQIVFFA